MKKLVLLTFSFFSITSFTQLVKLEGCVVLDSAQSAFGQFIIFSRADSVLVKGSYIDSTCFAAEFEPKEITGFYVKISVAGYKDTLINFDYTGSDVTLGTIRLSADRVLDAVDVVYVKPEFQRTMDGIKVNVQGTTLEQLTTLFDVLIASPKLSSPDNERIEIIGRGSPLILVDRQPIISNDELKAIPANMVESIEIITNPSAKYRAQGSGNGVIEVYTRNFNLEGYNMTVSGSGGINTQGKPTTGLNLGISLKRKKFSLNGYSGGSYNESNSFGTNSGFTTDDSQRSLQSDYNSDRWNTWNYYQLKSAYQFNKKHKLTGGLRGNISMGQSESSTTSTYYISSQLITSNSSYNDPYWSWLSNSAFLNYLWETDTNKSTFEVNLNLAQKGSNSRGTSQNTYVDALSGTTSDFNIRTESLDRPLVAEIRMNYEHIFDTTGWRINVGGTLSHLLNAKFYDQFNRVNDEWVIDPVYTNSYDYTEDIGAVFTEISKDWKKVSVRAGIRAEYTKLDGYSNSLQKQFIDSAYLLPFPSASVMLQPNGKVAITFGYSSGIERPQFSNYDPFVRLEDSLNISYGNPYLRPTMSHSFSMDIDLFYAYNISFSYSQSKDPISEISFVNDSSFITSTTPWNAALDQSVSASLNLPLQFDWLQGWNSIWASYSTYTFTPEFNRESFSNLNYGIYSYLTFKLPKSFSIMCQTHLSRWGSAQSVSNTQLNFGLRLTKKFMQDNFQVYLDVSNIFPPRSRYTQYSGNYQYSGSSQYDFTAFKLGLFYKFGRLKQAAHIQESSSGQSGRM